MSKRAGQPNRSPFQPWVLGIYNNPWTTSIGCWLPSAGPDPVGHKDLACSQAFLCTGGKRYASGDELDSPKAFNEPGDWALVRKISGSSASLA